MYGKTLLRVTCIDVYKRQIIIYALEVFQKHAEIDGIVISCLDGWEEMCKAYARQFGITKLMDVVTGGPDGQTSAVNGLLDMHKWCKEDDIVVIHDAIRPMVTEDIISDCIRVCREYRLSLIHISIHVPLLDSTKGMINSEKLEMMKDGCLLYTSRCV